MRNIKYRGLTTKGEFAYGSLVVTDSFLKHMPKQHSKTWIVTSAFGNGGWFNVRGRVYVKPDTVGQFTGLVDKNGAEVYEGDVLCCYHDDIYLSHTKVVEWSDDGRCELGITTNGRSGVILCSNTMESIEVVGNIHQPKELSQ